MSERSASTGNVFINIIVKTKDARDEVDDFQNEINKVGSLAKRTFAAIRREGKTILASIGSMVTVFRGMMKAIGQTIDPLFDTMLAGVMSAATSLLAIAQAWSMAPGIGQIVFVILAAASLGLTTGTVGAVLSGKAMSKDRIDGVQQTLTGLMGMMTASGRLF